MVGAVPWYGEVVRGPIRMADGCWQVPDAPGLGIEIDERVAARHPFEQEVLHTTNAVLAGRHGGRLVMAGRLQDKVAIVTGGGRGIGEATARAMAAQGAKVVVAELDVATGERTAAEIGGLFVPCDVREPAQLAEVAARTLAAHGRIDVLVANAGINVFHEPLETTEEEWRRCFAVDLDGVWHSCRAVLPTMLAQGGGSIVAIASCHSFAIIPHTFPYPVAKHGLLGLVRALGHRVRGQGRAGERDRSRLHRDADRARLLEHLPGPAGRAAEGLRPASAQARRQAGGGRHDRGVPGLGRGTLHQRRLHHDRWRALGALPRLTATAREATTCGILLGTVAALTLLAGVADAQEVKLGYINKMGDHPWFVSEVAGRPGQGQGTRQPSCWSRTSSSTRT